MHRVKWSMKMASANDGNKSYGKTSVIARVQRKHLIPMQIPGLIWDRFGFFISCTPLPLLCVSNSPVILWPKAGLSSFNAKSRPHKLLIGCRRAVDVSIIQLRNDGESGMGLGCLSIDNAWINSPDLLVWGVLVGLVRELNISAQKGYFNHV